MGTGARGVGPVGAEQAAVLGRPVTRHGFLGVTPEGTVGVEVLLGLLSGGKKMNAWVKVDLITGNSPARQLFKYNTGVQTLSHTRLCPFLPAFVCSIITWNQVHYPPLQSVSILKWIAGGLTVKKPHVCFSLFSDLSPQLSLQENGLPHCLIGTIAACDGLQTASTPPPPAYSLAISKKSSTTTE